MRLAIVGTDQVGSLALSLVRGAQESGHEAHAVYADRLISGWRPLFAARRAHVDWLLTVPLARVLERKLIALEPDLVVVVKGRFISAASVSRLSHLLGCPILNYYPDHPLWPGQDDPAILEALQTYDEVVVWAEHLADVLVPRGVNARVVPFGYDPAWYSPDPAPRGRAQRYDVVMIGQRYARRDAFVDAIADLRVLVSGEGWGSAATPAVRRLAGTKVYPPSAIREFCWESAFGLNILAPWNVPSHNMRTYEIPATATPMIATRTPEHERLFGVDGAVLVSEPAEAREQILTLLEDRDALRDLGRRGRACIQQYTYGYRMRQLLAPWS